MSDADPRDYRSLGDLLRDARKERRLSLEQLNESTRISVRVLQALEQDDLEAASGLVYVRGFVRTLATFYDLDPEWLGAKLDALAGETSRPVLPVNDDDDDVIAGPVPDPVVEEPPAATGPKWEVESTRVRHVGASSVPRVSRNLIFGLVAVLVLAIALVWWIGRDRGTVGDIAGQASITRTERASLDEEPGPETAGESSGLPTAEHPADPDPDPAPKSAELPRVARTDPGVAAAGTGAGPVRNGQSGPSLAKSRDPAVQDLPEESPPADHASQGLVEVEDPVNSAQTGLSSVLRPAEGGALSQMELRVLADGPVVVTLSSDGARQETRRLDPGEEWRLRGSDHFSLAVSDPTVVRLEIDGRSRQLPQNWNGEEWIIYPPHTDGGER